MDKVCLDGFLGRLLAVETDNFDRFWPDVSKEARCCEVRLRKGHPFAYQGRFSHNRTPCSAISASIVRGNADLSSKVFLSYTSKSSGPLKIG